MSDQEKSSLSQVASTAQTIHGAIKTGKAISAAAKGATVGGPPQDWPWEQGSTRGRSLRSSQSCSCSLFIIMLPSLIFGGLTSSGYLHWRRQLRDRQSLCQRYNQQCQLLYRSILRCQG